MGAAGAGGDPARRPYPSILRGSARREPIYPGRERRYIGGRRAFLLLGAWAECPDPAWCTTCHHQSLQRRAARAPVIARLPRGRGRRSTMRPELHHKVVCITGAAGGIGRAIAEAFAQEGARLALLDLNAAGLEE